MHASLLSLAATAAAATAAAATAAVDVTHLCAMAELLWLPQRTFSLETSMSSQASSPYAACAGDA
jgi:phosphate-selective porin